MVTDPARKRRTDPGNPDICPVFDLHKIFTPRGGSRRRARSGCRTAGIGCLDCKGVLLKHMLPPLAAIRERRQVFAEKPAGSSRSCTKGRGGRARSPQATMDEVRARGAPDAMSENATTSDLTLRVGDLRGPLRSPPASLPYRTRSIWPALPVRTITDQYLAHLEAMEFRDLEAAGAYLVMAATLIYLKSKLLVPPDDDAGRAARRGRPDAAPRARGAPARVRAGEGAGRVARRARGRAEPDLGPPGQHAAAARGRAARGPQRAPARADPATVDRGAGAPAAARDRAESAVGDRAHDG